MNEHNFEPTDDDFQHIIDGSSPDWTMQEDSYGDWVDEGHHSRSAVYLHKLTNTYYQATWTICDKCNGIAGWGWNKVRRETEWVMI